MKFLIVDTYYPAFLQEFYQKHPHFQHCSYTEQWQALMNQCFGTADFYSANLQKLGHEAHEVVVNNDILQRQWASEYAPHLASVYPLYRGLGRIKRWRTVWRWQIEVLKAQIAWFKPDILYVQDINLLDKRFFQNKYPSIRLIAGQTAYILEKNSNFAVYNLILSSLPHYVTQFRQQGISSEYFRIGFEPSVLQQLQPSSLTWQGVHVGGYGEVHNERNYLLEQVAQCVEVDFWGYGVENLSPDSSIQKRYHGTAWGLEMYQIRHDSRFTLTKHISTVAGSYANNMTLYEATGVGTCLVTDLKANLADLFEPDKEVVAYTNAEDCIEKITYLLTHEKERLAIAQAGQQRTLREHTYYHRMQELVDIVDRYLRFPEKTKD